MIDKLREIFPSIVEAKSDVQLDTNAYAWFSTNDNSIVGIPKEDLTQKESKLLETFLTPYYASQPPVTKREEGWIRVLFNGGDPAKELKTRNQYTYRFVYFSLSDTVDPIAFREAIHGLFPNQVPILWNSSHEGIIIEESVPSKEEETVSFHEIINVLVSDFYMDVHLYVGPYFKRINDAPRYYQWIKQCFDIVHNVDNRAVIDHTKAVPYLILAQCDGITNSYIIDSILQDTLQEEDLLETVRTFLECNSNATLAAKKLYMHRNSLQYRVDKFIEKTGIDVKQFEGALSVYLTLLLKDNKDT